MLKSLLLRGRGNGAHHGIDLWPAIQARLSLAIRPPNSNGGSKMQPSARRIPILVPGPGVVDPGALFVTTTPQGQALAQEFLSLFFRTAPDQRPLPTEDARRLPSRSADIAEGEAITGWHVFQLRTYRRGRLYQHRLPARERDGGAGLWFSKNDRHVRRVFLSRPAQNTVHRLCRWAKAPKSRPCNRRRHVICDRVWGGATDQLEWEANPNIQHLRWKANGYYFDMEFWAMGINRKIGRQPLLYFERKPDCHRQQPK